MPNEIIPHIVALYRYPVKGLGPQAMESAALEPGETIPFDRIYAIENGAGRFDPEEPRHLPKINFVMLMRNERLATLETEFETVSHCLTLKRDNRQVARGNLNTLIGRKMIEQFLAAYLSEELRGAPKIVFSEGHSFTDVAQKCVHIVNMASVRELERAAGQPIDPLRFRANIYIDGFEPWEEFRWIDQEIGIGNAKLYAFGRTNRCDATNVDPHTGKRDLAVPAILMRKYGHDEFGIYAKVMQGAEIRLGQPVKVSAPEKV